MRKVKILLFIISTVPLYMYGAHKNKLQKSMTKDYEAVKVIIKEDEFLFGFKNKLKEIEPSSEYPRTNFNKLKNMVVTLINIQKNSWILDAKKLKKLTKHLIKTEALLPIITFHYSSDPRPHFVSGIPEKESLWPRRAFDGPFGYQLTNAHHYLNRHPYLLTELDNFRRSDELIDD